ncbi:hypothetical protein GN956_G593, partial [Arapaima gigas]
LSLQAIRGVLGLSAFLPPTVRNHKAGNPKGTSVAETPDKHLLFGLVVLAHVLEYRTIFVLLAIFQHPAVGQASTAA